MARIWIKICWSYFLDQVYEIAVDKRYSKMVECISYGKVDEHLIIYIWIITSVVIRVRKKFTPTTQWNHGIIYLNLNPPKISDDSVPITRLYVDARGSRRFSEIFGWKLYEHQTDYSGEPQTLLKIPGLTRQISCQIKLQEFFLIRPTVGKGDEEIDEELKKKSYLHLKIPTTNSAQTMKVK